MNKVIKRIQIDLYSPTCYEVIKAQQGDDNTRIIEFEILNQGEPYILSNVFANLEGHRGNNTESSFIKKCNISQNIVSIVLEDDILCYSGIAKAKVILYDKTDGSILSTIPFKISIQKNPCDKDSVVTKNKSLIDDLVLEVHTLSSRVDELGDIQNIQAITRSQIDALF